MQGVFWFQTFGTPFFWLGLVCGIKEVKNQADRFKILSHFQRPIRAGMLRSGIR